MKQDNLIQHWQKIYEFQKNDFRTASLWQLIKNKIKGKKILDIGCGSGHYVLEILKSKKEICAIDNSREMIELTNYLLSKNGFSEKAMLADVCKIKLNQFENKKFDSVLCLDVIEHIENDISALKSIIPLLSPNGILILSVPAIKRLYGKRDKHIGHYRRYSKKELKNKLSQNGFKIKKIFYWNFIGLIPFFIFEKILHLKINENFRYKKTATNKIINFLLKNWLTKIENHIPMPIGLTLVSICEKKIINY